MSVPPEATHRRAVYMVLSPHALPYAQLALSSLLRNAAEPLHLTLITDSPADKQVLGDTLQRLPFSNGSAWTVWCEDDLADREAERFRDLPNLRALRHGHPCWRKITDPLLLSPEGEEIILLDPDLYFPNPFTFELTPAQGLLLMWQQPNCLFPPEIVHRALEAGIPLARHVDIGVSHWRGQVDLHWLDGLIGTLGGATLPRIMHVEAILWAAIALKIGGGHLDPARWVCWRRTQVKRVRARLGSKADLLNVEPWQEMKCFHAGGDAKWWLAEALQVQRVEPRAQLAESAVRPFLSLTETRYACEQGAKRMLGHLGYYRLFDAKAK